MDFVAKRNDYCMIDKCVSRSVYDVCGALVEHHLLLLRLVAVVADALLLLLLLLLFLVLGTVAVLSVVSV